MNSLDPIIAKARRRLLDLHYVARSGHIGGNFSCIDALVTLYHAVMRPEDRFVLSKGHSAGALYVTLWSMGRLSDDQLATFCKDDTVLPGHPSGTAIDGVLFSTGSLGHGPSLAAGLSLAARNDKSTRHIFCLCSDGEWQEGSCWEALIFSVHQRLNNLTILIDQNGWQGFGSTSEIVSFSDLSSRVTSFGANLISVDGHDPVAIMEGLSKRSSDRPNVVILNTMKGRGLHFEDRLESHYLPLSDEQYAAAKARIESEQRS
ncbi:MAG TPA: transketolase [Dongiaceae bacterium]|nr:transketolase [Dongiaceae bacterium]